MNDIVDATGFTISFDDFERVEMRVGTIVQIQENAKARVPAYVMQIDFGAALGIKTSSAQITTRYEMSELLGAQITAVMNFAPKRVAGIVSEVLVLAAVGSDGVAVLVRPSLPVDNGSRIL